MGTSAKQQISTKDKATESSGTQFKTTACCTSKSKYSACYVFPLPLKKRKNEDANSSMSFTGHRSIPVQAHHVVLRLLLLTILLFCTTKSITHNALTKTQCAPLTSTYTCCGRGAGKTTYHTQIRRLKERPSERSENQSATLHACSGYLFHCWEQGEVEQW